MTIKSMVLKKCYLLAGVMMAANIFVVNEVKAMKDGQENDNKINTNPTNAQSQIPTQSGPQGTKIITHLQNSFQLGPKTGGPNTNPTNAQSQIPTHSNPKGTKIITQFQNPFQSGPKTGGPNTQSQNPPQSGPQITTSVDHSKQADPKGISAIFDFFILNANYINIIGGVAFSLANNYFKIYELKSGPYTWWGCYGWRSKRFLKGYLQCDLNFNPERGLFWLFLNLFSNRNGNIPGWLHIGIKSFFSAPLTIYIGNFFYISIPLDAIVWLALDKLLLDKWIYGEDQIKEENMDANSAIKPSFILNVSQQQNNNNINNENDINNIKEEDSDDTEENENDVNKIKENQVLLEKQKEQQELLKKQKEQQELLKKQKELELLKKQKELELLNKQNEHQGGNEPNKETINIKNNDGQTEHEGEALNTEDKKNKLDLKIDINKDKTEEEEAPAIGNTNESENKNQPKTENKIDNKEDEKEEPKIKENEDPKENSTKTEKESTEEEKFIGKEQPVIDSKPVNK